MASGARKTLAMAVGAALVLAGIGAYVWYESARPRVFELYVFNTPGMPSLFIRTADDRRILINGGANGDIVGRLTGLLPFYSRRIDEIIATDDDSKNVTGLVEVLNRYEVGEAIFRVATSDEPAYDVFLKSAEKAKVSKLSTGVTNASTGWRLFELPGISLDLYDQKKGICVLRAGSETVLIVPLNQNALTKKALSASRPDYLIYSAQVQSNQRTTQKSDLKKPGLLAGVLMDRRFNIRESGGVRITTESGRIIVQPLRQ